MSESSTPSDTADRPALPPKRKASAAGLDGHGNGTGRSVKRRASKACQCCRARKVRCNVTEHGAPCTNCRLDEVECVVSESRRKKKWAKDAEASTSKTASASHASQTRKLASREALDGLSNFSATSRKSRESPVRVKEHVPHSIYQSHGQKNNLGGSSYSRRMTVDGPTTPAPLSLFGQMPMSADSHASVFSQFASKQAPSVSLPPYIKPLPARIGADEITYLEKKGAFTIPSDDIRNELLRAYINFVHPYMPLLDLHDFVQTIDQPDGSCGKVSLILYQAVMFAGSAFIDMSHLRGAGYNTRKEARRGFFQKARLLYDFDYESDRVSLVQALLLLTYYYETPDDQKDTWHWMGVATSVAHTIGLHRNPERSTMDAKRVKLWKRIWWSTYMRDRLIALGMRRPTRIKTEDYDVPMLTLDDFEIGAIPDTVSCVPADCVVAKDVDRQRQLALMCISKAKLCLCVSHVLSKQYCVLNNNQGMVNDRTTMMLLPKKFDPDTCDVQMCDEELRRWQEELPAEARYSETSSGLASIDLCKALLHMVFFTTLSALHRPQVLPSANPTQVSSPAASPAGSPSLLEVSRKNVRRAAAAITSIAQKLDQRDLVRYLPTTGVTVLLPAIIIHLLDIKAPDEATRRASLRGFCQCMAVMGKLRDLYSAADYSTAFLEAAIRKAGISLAPFMAHPPSCAASAAGAAAAAAMPLGASANSMKARHSPTVDDIMLTGRQMGMDPPSALFSSAARELTPPPDAHSQRLSQTPIPNLGGGTVTDDGAVASPFHGGVSIPSATAGGGGELPRTIAGNATQLPPGIHNNGAGAGAGAGFADAEVVRRLETFLASTPPESDHHSEHAAHLSDGEHEGFGHGGGGEGQHDGIGSGGMADQEAVMNAALGAAGAGAGERAGHGGMVGSLGDLLTDFDADLDFDSIFNLDGTGDGFSFDDVSCLQGESSGFTADVDCMKAGLVS
ncbi:fungal-specific transcription factor domain-containing protein [Lineolata rhizophorae]|uniref:Fungal-specific transcription factor domain-containing protein n=1 Tax=Lineolata rhizophorae TaxID=578093 RepID=A0A6A6PAE0_9PEZI|nr:fungal-specific transcription factor domain-containing protein [Lineolata rhizophorae]